MMNCNSLSFAPQPPAIASTQPTRITQLKKNNNNSNINSKKAKKSFLHRITPTAQQFARIAVALSLSVTTVIIGYTAFYVFSSLQAQTRLAQYSALVRKVQVTALETLTTNKEAVGMVANTALNFCPTIEMWPNCTISMKVYGDVFNGLNRITQTLSFSVYPIVAPSQVKGFESFAQSYFNGSGIANISTEVFAINTTTNQRYHDISGHSGGGEYEMLLPNILTTAFSGFAAILMFNIYSERHRGLAVDYAMNCVKNHSNHFDGCFATSSLLIALRDSSHPQHIRPISMMMLPIIPVGSTTVVGFAATGYYWDRVLNVASNNLLDGIMVVVSDGILSYTYEYNNGDVGYPMVGDHHDSSHNDQRYSFMTPSNGPAQYTVTLYPSNRWIAIYQNKLPVIVAMVAVALVLFSSIVFFIYDHLVNKLATHQELVLQTKRQYVRYISHEIRTPLNVVHMGFQVIFTEMMQALAKLRAREQAIRNFHNALISTNIQDDAIVSTAVLTDWLDLVRDIVESSQSAVLVLNDLIDYDKIDTSTMALQMEALPVWELVDSAISPFMVQARMKKVKLQLILDDDDPIVSVAINHRLVLGDRIKLTQVIRNLVSNAIKFTSVGGMVNITVGWKTKCANQSELDMEMNTALNDTERIGAVVIHVQDSGAGMSERNVSKLFREGVQFNPNQLQAGQGSGLGLWISKGIVNLHGGSLSATSPGEGQGSQFTLEFPLFKSTAIESLDIEEGSDNKEDDEVLSIASIKKDFQHIGLLTESSQARRFHNVLVVDDSAINRKMISRSLTMVGFSCFQAESGGDCLKFLNNSINDPIQLILMDYEMPGMNGPTAASELRKMGCSIPIIGVTGNVMQEDKDYFVAHGANYVVNKPFTVTDLDDALKKFIVAQQDPILL